MYELVDRGQVPINVDDVKAFLRVDGGDEDDVIQGLIVAACVDAEVYMGRDIRANTWRLYIDEFEDRICLRRSPVTSITSVKYTVSDVLQTIATSVWYLKKGHQWSELLLKSGQVWPTDLDDIEAGIQIEFVTGEPRDIERILEGVKRHVAAMYSNRGDYESKNLMVESGAVNYYKRIARFAGV